MQWASVFAPQKPSLLGWVCPKEANTLLSCGGKQQSTNYSCSQLQVRAQSRGVQTTQRENLRMHKYTETQSTIKITRITKLPEQGFIYKNGG